MLWVKLSVVEIIHPQSDMLLQVWRIKDTGNSKPYDSTAAHKLLINKILFAIQTRHVTLEDAANVLIGEEEEGQTKYKSKKLAT